MPARDAVADFERALADVSADARLYVQPAGLVAGRIAAGLVVDGRARPLAGGPLAMTLGELTIRSPATTRRVVVDAGALHRWSARGAAPAARIAALLERIEAPRQDLGDRPRLMGVVNVTPDSFSDGGAHRDSAAALAQCRALAQEGADIVDIGGESTRPGAAPVAPAEELARLRPVLDGLPELRAEFPDLLVSIDTRHAEVMRAGLAAGADLINDVSALTAEPENMDVAAASAAQVVLMHMQGEPATMNLAPVYDDVVLDVFDYLEARIAACKAAGIPRRRLIVDPGFGFGKRGAQNLELLRALPLFHGLGCPILIGLSRKGLGLGQGDLAPAARQPASLAAATLALSQGVQVLRVHDVAATGQAVALWQKLNGGSIK